jgi:hypothetical protein
MLGSLSEADEPASLEWRRGDTTLALPTDTATV